MNKCENCDAPFKTLYRVKWELFHLRWIHICKNCGKQIRQVYGDTLIFGGNANYPKGNNGGGVAMGGRGGQTTGYLTGTGGDGGSKGGDLPGNPGNPGGAFSYGNGGNGTDGNGQRGGFGYYGGGGGGGFWDQGESNNPGGAGGGGSNYIGGLPGTAPAPVPVANTSSGNEPGGALIQLVSIVT